MAKPKKDATTATVTDEQDVAMLAATDSAEPEVQTEQSADKPSMIVRSGTDTHFIPKHVNIPGVQDAPEGPMRIKKEFKKNTTNPSELAFPTDRWGLTKDVKAALVAMTARICGSPEKYELAKETLDTLLAYLDARYEFDKAARGA